MTTFIKIPFAQSGDKTNPPDTDVAGGVNWTQGYGTAYSKDPAADPSAKRIEREEFNGVLNRLSTAIREIQYNGITPYITPSDNGGSAFAYDKGVLVLYQEEVYQSRIAGNVSLPSVAADWYKLSIGDVKGSSIAGMSSGLKLSTTGVSHTVSISAAAVCLENAAGAQQTVKTLSLQLNLSTSGANGLDTGVLAASTWYAVWVISDGATTAVIGSLSATAPTLPVGYTYAARIGWIRTDSSANKYPLSMVQVGKSVQYKVVAGSNVPSLPTIITGAYSTPAAANVATLVPPSAGKIKLAAGITGTGYVGFAPNNSYSSAPGSNYLSASTPTGYPFVGGYNASSPVPTANGELVLEAMTVYYAANGAGGILQCVGWEEF